MAPRRKRASVDQSNFSGDTYDRDGMWRSLVARTLGVGEAPSSNLGIPMQKKASDPDGSEAFFVS